MTHPDRQVALEGEVQLRLVDAWEVLNEVVEMTDSAEFGRSLERQEWRSKMRAIRGCLLLAAARLIDVHHVEALPTAPRRCSKRAYTGHAFAKRRARTNGESAVVALADEVGKAHREFDVMCPLGVPLMEFDFGRLAKWIEAGELRVSTFFGVGSSPGRQCAKQLKEKIVAKQRLRSDLAAHDALVESAAVAMRRRAGVE